MGTPLILAKDGGFEAGEPAPDDVYYVTTLHHHPELLDDCCELINMEWKRSHVARLRSISGSCENFPTSLILVKASPKPVVIGHCKVNKLSPSAPVVFVDTVVIHPDYRRRGLGKLLMLKTEQYLQRKNIEWIYLTTLDQQLFYERVGYSSCEPINIYGSCLNYISETSTYLDVNTQRTGTLENIKNVDSKNQAIISTPNQNSFAIPPPPPLPSLNSSNPSNITILNTKKLYMHKKIA